MENLVEAITWIYALRRKYNPFPRRTIGHLLGLWIFKTIGIFPFFLLEIYL
jgi:hypothetical protein